MPPPGAPPPATAEQPMPPEGEIDPMMLEQMMQTQPGM
jgi:hypothetical protein